MWSQHDRLEEHIDERSCSAEIESFLRHGQLVPVLGRRLHRDPTHDIELIYGARRLFVAQHINKEILVQLREVSDIEAIVAIDIENRQRTDVSPYERGLSFARWLRAGLFQSQDDLARALNLSPSVVSRMLKVARLPAVIIGAFADPTEICESWCLRLFEALEDPVRRDATVRAARAITSSGELLSAPQAYRQLLAAAPAGRKVRARARDEVIKDQSGHPLIRIRYQRDSIAVLVPIEKVSKSVLESMKSALLRILDSPHVVVSPLRSRANDPA
jgi:ParB family chromosome partitioning protein